MPGPSPLVHPCAALQSKEPAISVFPASRDRTRLLVVVAEDDDDARTMVGVMLEFFGFDVILSADGRDALDAVLAHRPDAVVSDMNMPQLDGLELCRAIRAVSAWDAVPVVLWSSVPPEDSRLREAIGFGGVEYVSKSLAVTNIGVALRRIHPQGDLAFTQLYADVEAGRGDQCIDLLPSAATAV